jgi:hypothetical protein
MNKFYDLFLWKFIILNVYLTNSYIKGMKEKVRAFCTFLNRKVFDLMQSISAKQ